MPSAAAWPESDISEVRIAHSRSIAMLASCFVALYICMSAAALACLMKSVKGRESLPLPAALSRNVQLPGSASRGAVPCYQS